jgi:hypothetical protein
VQFVCSRLSFFSCAASDTIFFFFKERRFSTTIRALGLDSPVVMYQNSVG